MSFKSQMNKLLNKDTLGSVLMSHCIPGTHECNGEWQGHHCASGPSTSPRASKSVLEMGRGGRGESEENREETEGGVDWGREGGTMVTAAALISDASIPLLRSTWTCASKIAGLTAKSSMARSTGAAESCPRVREQMLSYLKKASKTQNSPTGCSAQPNWELGRIGQFHSSYPTKCKQIHFQCKSNLTYYWIPERFSWRYWHTFCQFCFLYALLSAQDNQLTPRFENTTMRKKYIITPKALYRLFIRPSSQFC